jgi:two-component system NtrC family sensor kinase
MLVRHVGVTTGDAFQALLLRLSAAAARGVSQTVLLETVCREAREAFDVSGVYFWRAISADELIGQEADGVHAERFRGLRLKASESAAAAESIQVRKTIFVNRLEAGRFRCAAEFGARSIMATPLIVADQVVGALTFLHDSEAEFFNDDLSAKATILAGQLGSLLEARRLSEVSREDHRRAEILAEVANALHGVPDTGSVLEGLADRIRVLLRTRLVCVLSRQEGPFELRAVAAENPQLATVAKSRYDRNALRMAADLAARAVTLGEVLTVSIEAASHGLSELVPSGMLMAAPFRTSRTQGAILVYPRHDGVFTVDERSLVTAIAGFGAVAIANAELYATARGQAHELHQLLEISSELGSIGTLDEFLGAFVVRAADFFGYRRSFVALLEDGVFHVRWGAEDGGSRPVSETFPEGVATRVLKSRDIFWSDDVRQIPGANLSAISKFNIKQLLAVPLLASDRRILGMFGLLDRLDAAGISQEDLRRARALAGQVAVAFEVKSNLHSSEQQRSRAEAIVGLAHEWDALLQSPSLNRRLVARIADLVGAEAAALALYEDSVLEAAVTHKRNSDDQDVSVDLRQRLSRALDELLTSRSEPVISGTAEDLLGTGLASGLGWNDCVVVRLKGGSTEPLGVLCLAQLRNPLRREDEQFLATVANHAAIRIENARLFRRLEKASRHWLEIFDAISDFIVVHDETHTILRVNRSLADFIGVAPPELIGVQMRTLLSLGQETSSRSCPFCRFQAETPDEYVHRVLDRSYLVSTSPVHGGNSDRRHTVHVLKDITDRREAERRYRELFDNIQEGLFFAVPNGRFIEVNDALVRMLGYTSREDLLSADPSRDVYLSPERLQRMCRLMEQHGVLRDHEEMIRRKDGTPIHVLINAFAVPDAHGQLQQYRGLMLDITGLKNYQAELQRERDFSGKILNNTQSLILVVDTAGLISYANRRWDSAGFERQRLLGRPLIDLVSPSRRQATEDGLAATLAGCQVDNLELQVFRADGRTGQFSVNLSPMRDEAGHVTSIVVVMTDITDSAVLQSKLLHAEKLAAVGQLVSGVAHEVNNPLTAILGFADLLSENPDLPEVARRDLRVILQEAQRTKQIVQNLLSFARQMPPQRKAVQLNGILRRTVQLRAYDFNSHGVQVVEHLDENLPMIVGDSHQLQQVFLNILNNAYDAVREVTRAPRIEIMTASLGSFVEVSFRDNGPGIAHPDRIFDPFFTTKEVGKGTGLGLSICYGIVREHNGEILCHNNAGGEGATFIVRLPAATETASMGAAAGVVQR